MNISSKGFVATPKEIGELTKEILSAQQTELAGRGTYLRALVATTTQELGLPPRVNARKAVKLKGEDIARHVAALDAVHARFLEAVTEAASDNLPVKNKALELNRRTGFARSAAATCRAYIRAGNDITALVPARVVKAALYVAAKPSRPPTAARLKGSVERRSKALMVDVLALVDTDKPAAVAELQLLIGQLAAQLADLGVKPVKDAHKAAAEHVPFMSAGGHLFVPTQSTVLRQQARPS